MCYVKGWIGNLCGAESSNSLDLLGQIIVDDDEEEEEEEEGSE
jgi:hypothetical protein